jgi:hypothetical protein
LCYREITLRHLINKIGEPQMPQNEKTSKRLATLAAKVLADPNASEDAKSLAGSVLTQTPDKPPKPTGSAKPANKPKKPKKP